MRVTETRSLTVPHRPVLSFTDYKPESPATEPNQRRPAKGRHLREIHHDTAGAQSANAPKQNPGRARRAGVMRKEGENQFCTATARRRWRITATAPSAIAPKIAA